MLSINDLRKLGSTQMLDHIRQLSNAEICALAQAIYSGAVGTEILAASVALHLATRLEVASA